MGAGNRIKPSLRDKVMASSEGYCVLAGPNCTVFATTIDHWMPRCRGGTNRKGNLAGACARCNHDKGKMWPEEWKLFVNDPVSWNLLKSKRQPERKMTPAERDTFNTYGVKPWESFDGL